MGLFIHVCHLYQVSMDDLTEAIEALEDYVQSVDVAAMQKI